MFVKSPDKLNGAKDILVFGSDVCEVDEELTRVNMCQFSEND